MFSFDRSDQVFHLLLTLELDLVVAADVYNIHESRISRMDRP